MGEKTSPTGEALSHSKQVGARAGWRVQCPCGSDLRPRRSEPPCFGTLTEAWATPLRFFAAGGRSHRLRARSTITAQTAHFRASRRPSGKARKGAHTCCMQPFLQHSRAGWDGVPKWVVIVERALIAIDKAAREWRPTGFCSCKTGTSAIHSERTWGRAACACQ